VPAQALGIPTWPGPPFGPDATSKTRAPTRSISGIKPYRGFSIRHPHPLTPSRPPPFAQNFAKRLKCAREASPRAPRRFAFREPQPLPAITDQLATVHRPLTTVHQCGRAILDPGNRRPHSSSRWSSPWRARPSSQCDQERKPVSCAFLGRTPLAPHDQAENSQIPASPIPASRCRFVIQGLLPVTFVPFLLISLKDGYRDR
jgi:hypothetical protein